MGLQAIIMAGGEGVRLRPLTCSLPKPLVPLLGEPCMGYALRLMRQHGITRIGSTLWYRPKCIRDTLHRGERWGVSLRYYEETVPLGTAGSLRMAMNELKDTFFVLSGDGLTDCDLTQAMAFHREKGAVATLVLKRVGIPLPYGVVVTDGSGRITRFLEKPAWGEVVSDLVNTGIYILEPEIFSHIPEGGMPDFGKDVFPALVRSGLPVYGYETDGYWCDIGDLRAYLKAQQDLLSGRVRLPHPAGVDPAARVDPAAEIGDECWIGPGAVIGPGARVIRSAVGPDAAVGEGAVVTDSCLWTRAAVRSKARVAGSVLCTGAAVRSGAETGEDCALGPGAVAGPYAVLRPGVRVWPHLKVAPGAVAARNVVTEDVAAPQWSSAGAACTDPGDVCALCSAYRKVTGAQRVIVGGPDGALRSLAEGALAAAGAKVFGAGEVSWPMLRTLIRALRLEGGAYAGGGALRFADRQGRALSARQQSAVSACVLRQDLPPAFDGSGEVTHLSGAEAVYLSALLPGDAGRETALPVLVCCASGPLRRLAAEALRRMGVTQVRTAEGTPLPELGETGFLLTPDGESVSLFTRERVYAPEQTALLRLLLLHREQGRLYDLPGTPRAAQEISALQPPDGSDACARQRTAAEDGLASMLLICRFLREKSLDAWMAETPRTHLVTREIPCRTEDKGRVVRQLWQTAQTPHVLGEGVRFSHPRGFATVAADAHRGVVRITAEAGDTEFARELCDLYAGRVRALTEGRKMAETEKNAPFPT